MYSESASKWLTDHLQVHTAVTLLYRVQRQYCHYRLYHTSSVSILDSLLPEIPSRMAETVFETMNNEAAIAG